MICTRTVLPTVTIMEQKYTRIHISKHADKLEKIQKKPKDKKYVYHFFFFILFHFSHLFIFFKLFLYFYAHSIHQDIV